MDDNALMTLDQMVPGNHFSPHLGYARGMTDDEIADAARVRLAAEGRTKDLELIIVPTDKIDVRRVIVQGSEQNPWGFDHSDLHPLGYIPRASERALSEVVWDRDRPLWVGDSLWEGQCPFPVTVFVEELRSLRDDEPPSWVVMVEGHIGGITTDPGIVGRVGRGEVKNLDGLTFSASRIVPMRRNVLSEVDALLGQPRTELGFVSVDSGQVMVSDVRLDASFGEGDSKWYIGEHDDSFTYTGACSRSSEGGGVLLHEGTAVAAVAGTDDGGYPVLRLGDGGPSSALMIDLSVSGAEPDSADDLGTFRLGGEARLCDPCHLADTPVAEVVPGLYRAVALMAPNEGERRAAALIVHRIGD